MLTKQWWALTCNKKNSEHLNAIKQKRNITYTKLFFMGHGELYVLMVHLYFDGSLILHRHFLVRQF